MTVVVTNERHDADEMPVINGTAQVGETLTVDTSPMADTEEDTTFFYSWWRIEGDTEAYIDGSAETTSYTLTADDEGKTIQIMVSFQTAAEECV